MCVTGCTIGISPRMCRSTRGSPHCHYAVLNPLPMIMLFLYFFCSETDGIDKKYEGSGPPFSLWLNGTRCRWLAYLTAPEEGGGAIRTPFLLPVPLPRVLSPGGVKCRPHTPSLSHQRPPARRQPFCSVFRVRWGPSHAPERPPPLLLFFSAFLTDVLLHVVYLLLNHSVCGIVTYRGAAFSWLLAMAWRKGGGTTVHVGPDTNVAVTVPESERKDSKTCPHMHREAPKHV